ncbi:MAG: hypothetical protein HC920_05600 [Oscillatoriales cyanobacterium SM2_3_0]|nr:hypothetical protein [Oscillatoriales cyanobacterium SM2_3_0]
MIDEVDQVLRSMLTSPTNNKNGLRPAILARFEQMVRTAARVIVASADVSDLEINYIQELRPELRPFVILNEYQPPGYRVNHLKSSNPQVIISRMMAAAKAGEKLFISTGSKGKAKTIHKLLLKQNPNLKIMLVTSETSGSKEQIDFIQNINQRVREYDIVIATPSMGTGVSIEIEYFDQVFGLYPGVLTDWEIAQALGRVRANIPRTIWVAPVGKSFSKVSTSEYPNLVRRSLKDIRGASNQATEAMIARTSLRPDLNPLLEHDWNWDNNPHIHLWAQYQAKTNRSMWCLRDHVIARLEHEGNTVIEESPDPDPGGKEEIKQAKAEVEAAEHQAILEAPEISATEAEALERKLNLSPEENAKLQRYKVENFYRGPVTIEILKLDNKGRYRSKLTQIEYLLDGGELALNSDYRKFEQQIQHGQGAFAPDMGLSALRFQVREILNLKAYIQPGIQYDDAALEELGNLCRSYAPAIKLVLGLSIPQDASNCWIFRKLWEQLGVKTQGQRVGKGRRRLVWIDGDGFNQLAEILNRRYFHRVGLGSVEETWNQCGGNSEVGVAGLPIYKNKEETGLLCGCI